MPDRFRWLLVALAAALAILAIACGGGDDDDTPLPDDDDAGDDDDSVGDDDFSDDDFGDDDFADDDDDDIPFEPWVNPDARADAFRLFYRERLDRTLLAYNRFLLVNDVVPAHTLGSTNIARSGDVYDIQLHPVDNNEIGTSAFNTYAAETVFRSRGLSLTLIRQFEGLAVAEEVMGIPGLTCREWQTGYTTTIDGPSGEITRTRDGVPAEPAEAYPSALEAEIVDAFFADGTFTYNAEPTDHYFTVESITRPQDYAVTLVFEEMPDYLRISNCCSSFMVSKLGPFAGYFWGNHNSRDNMPDFALGYFAACVAADDESLDADVRSSAARACASGRRIGDSIVENGYNMMTVSEFEPYDADHLIVAGELRPDGTDEGLEWLGSMNSCQMSYMAKAMSSSGLSSPDEQVRTPGAYELLAIKYLFELIGIELPDTAAKTCRFIDDGYFGMTWGEILDKKVFGASLWNLVDAMMHLVPDTVVPLVKELTDATHQPEKSAYALVYYARTSGKGDLLQEARETLYHIVEIQRRGAMLLLDWAYEQDEPPADIINKANSELVVAAQYAHAAGVGSDLFDPQGFARANGYQNALEAVLNRGDSTPRTLWTDEQIWARIEDELDGYSDRPNVYDRYFERFPTPDDRPIWRDGDGYRVIDVDGEWQSIPNISHQGFGGVHLWDTLPICALEPTVLDCEWAAIGCARPDLDGSGAVDSADRDLFDDAWQEYAQPGGDPCAEANDWCAGGDLDRNGELESDDIAFVDAAMGCWY